MFFNFLFSYLVIGFNWLQTPATEINKTRILKLVNEARSRGCNCGDKWYGPAAAVTWNDVLEKAAKAHSKDMAKNKSLQHHSSTGSGPGERIRNAGYNWILYGENIALGYNTEKEVIAGWLKSPGHCSNLMNPSFKEMGVARSGSYWTQDFGTK